MSNLNLGSFGDKRSSPRINADALNHLPKHRRDWLEVFSDTQGKPAKVMPGTCEACVFGRGEHSEACEGRSVGRSCDVPRIRLGMTVEEAWAQQAKSRYGI